MPPTSSVDPVSADRRVTATAPGKVILVGEHAVVYGRPAIAVPVWQTVATAQVEASSGHARFTIHAQDIDRTFTLASDVPLASTDAPVHSESGVVQEDAEGAPLLLVARATLQALGYIHAPPWIVKLHSEIPMASGLGSGAALSAALARGLWEMARRLDAALPPPDPARISEIVFLAEQIYHGTPSGIDNTVVAYGAPVWFRRGESPRVFTPARPCEVAIADSGTPGKTRTTVAHVRQLYQANPLRFDTIFDRIGALVEAARGALEAGIPGELGPLFDENHALLQQLEVSTPELDHLVEAARQAGAHGAKLSGGGGGGNVIALVDAACGAGVEAALLAAGARRVILTTVGP